MYMFSERVTNRDIRFHYETNAPAFRVGLHSPRASRLDTLAADSPIVLYNQSLPDHSRFRLVPLRPPSWPRLKSPRFAAVSFLACASQSVMLSAWSTSRRGIRG